MLHNLPSQLYIKKGVSMTVASHKVISYFCTPIFSVYCLILESSVLAKKNYMEK